MPTPTAPALADTRDALHDLARRVLAPAARHAGGDGSLVAIADGMAASRVPGGAWLGVRGSSLRAVAADGAERREPITSLRAAGAFFGLPAADDLPDAALTFDTVAARAITSALEGGARALTELLLLRGAHPATATAVRLSPESLAVAAVVADPGKAGWLELGVTAGRHDDPRPVAYVNDHSVGDGADVIAELAAVPFVGRGDALAFFRELLGT